LKKGFTLVEIIIVIILISILYLFAINKFDNISTIKSTKVSLNNLKETLLSYNFDSKIEIKCINDDLSCMMFIDDQIQDIKIESLFESMPSVYTYNKNPDRIEFLDLDLEQLQRYTIIFEYSCTSDQRCSEIIVETNEKTYIFNNMNRYPVSVEYFNDINDYFEKKITEVKDAF
jgi:prepilin-type N-terminal cleavage/methylation domain-containing protein